MYTEQELNDKRELAELIKATFEIHGFEGWITSATGYVRTNATLSQARAILAEVEYPQHLIVWNTSYSTGGDESFKVLVRSW